MKDSYLSTIQLNPHFGLGVITKIDSLVVKWPDGSKEVLKNVVPDQTIKIDKKNARYAIVSGHGHNSIVNAVAKIIAEVVLA